MSGGEQADPDLILGRVGFDPDQCVLTRRQAEVLALRERDLSQREIAEMLGTSRANISSIEASARRNVEKARETTEIVDALQAPVHVHIPAGTDLFDVPEEIYETGDAADTKVAATSAEVIRTIREAAPDSIEGGRVNEPLTIVVASDGAITVLSTTDA